jgi:hypothetical protein
LFHLSVATGTTAAGVYHHTDTHPIAGGKLFYSRPNSYYLSDNLMSGHHGILSPTPFIPYLVQVTVTHATIMNLDVYIIRTQVSAIK